MCNAGIPVLDVFQMTESAPTEGAVLKSIKNILTNYYRKHPSRQCIKKSKVKKENIDESRSSSLMASGIENNFKTLLSENTGGTIAVNSLNNATIASLFTIV